MLEVQKESYLSIILSNVYSEDSFVAKSVTLDFLFSFSNSYVAFVALNECLNENNRLAKIGLNCIYGIMLAVKEYKEITQTTIIYKFISTLINVMPYKIDDVTICNYRKCMENILEFIAENVDFKLIIPFFELANSFSYCEGILEERECVFTKYYDVLKSTCIKLKKEDSNLLCYKLSPLKDELNTIETENNKVLSAMKTILNSIFDYGQEKIAILLVVSNLKTEENKLVNSLQKNHQDIKVNTISKEEIKDIQQINNLKILFLIDLKENDSNELLYWFGVMEGRLNQGQLLGCFYHCENKVGMFYQTLIDRYATENNLEDKILKFLG